MSNIHFDMMDIEFDMEEGLLYYITNGLSLFNVTGDVLMNEILAGRYRVIGGDNNDAFTLLGLTTPVKIEERVAALEAENESLKQVIQEMLTNVSN